MLRQPAKAARNRAAAAPPAARWSAVRLSVISWEPGAGIGRGRKGAQTMDLTGRPDPGIAAVPVDWRRPPGHPFPAPMDDCYAGLARAFGR